MERLRNDHKCSFRCNFCCTKHALHCNFSRARVRLQISRAIQLRFHRGIVVRVLRNPANLHQISHTLQTPATSTGMQIMLWRGSVCSFSARTIFRRVHRLFIYASQLVVFKTVVTVDIFVGVLLFLLLYLVQVSLDSLMSTLRSTNVHYIRCIKPNTSCQPGIFDTKQVFIGSCCFFFDS